MDNKKLISVVEKIDKFLARRAIGANIDYNFPEERQTLQEILHILKTLDSIEILKKKVTIETGVPSHFDSGYNYALKECSFALTKYRLRAEKAEKELKVVEKELQHMEGG